jgi:hypothetical protein
MPRSSFLLVCVGICQRQPTRWAHACCLCSEARATVSAVAKRITGRSVSPSPIDHCSPFCSPPCCVACLAHTHTDSHEFTRGPVEKNVDWSVRLCICVLAFLIIFTQDKLRGFLFMEQVSSGEKPWLQLSPNHMSTTCQVTPLHT